MANENETAENRVQVSIFLTPDMKSMLEDAARQNFRTVSSEAAYRLAQSFRQAED